MENRKPAFEIAVVGMLMMQFLLFSLLAWKLLGPAVSADVEKDKQKIEELETKLGKISSQQDQSTRERAFNEVLSTLVGAQTGDANLVDKFTELQTQQTRMESNLEGQLALTDRLKNELKSFEGKLIKEEASNKKLSSQLVTTREKLKQASADFDVLETQVKNATKDGEIDIESLISSNGGTPWYWLAIGGMMIGLVGCAVGFALARRDGYDDYGSQYSRNPSRNEEGPSKFETSSSPERNFSNGAEQAAEPGESDSSQSVPLTIDGEDSSD